MAHSCRTVRPQWSCRSRTALPNLRLESLIDLGISYSRPRLVSPQAASLLVSSGQSYYYKSNEDETISSEKLCCSLKATYQN
jgi:hypothetical protein